MPSKKLMNGLAHDLGHHAISGLCEVVGHLYLACSLTGAKQITIDLLGKPTLSKRVLPNKELKLSIQALKDKLVEMLRRLGFATEDISAASLHFTFRRLSPLKRASDLLFSTPWSVYPSYRCESEIVTKTGRHYKHVFNQSGERAESGKGE